MTERTDTKFLKLKIHFWIHYHTEKETSHAEMAEQTIPASLWPYAGPAPQLSQVLGQVAGLLNDLGYSKTSSALEKEAVKKTGLTKLDPATGLLALYNSLDAATTSASDSDADSESSDNSSDDSDDDSEQDEVEGALLDVEAEETSDDSSDEKSSVSSSSAAPAKTSTKRKRAATPSSSGSSSSSDEDSNSSSDDSDARPAKRSKTVVASKGANTPDSSSSESSSDSSSSDSDSSSADSAADDSSDDSDSSSSSSSSDDSSSDSESDSPPVKTKKAEKQKATSEAAVSQGEVAKDNGSQSSATLQGDSPEAEEKEEDMSGIHPDRLRRSQFAPVTKKEGAANAKKAAVPFSRIPADQKVDPRFSNQYVSYDYADKAYQDLVVTKGKGFTKEKNKKKRGGFLGRCPHTKVMANVLQVHTEVERSIWHRRVSSLTTSDYVFLVLFATWHRIVTLGHVQYTYIRGCEVTAT